MTVNLLSPRITQQHRNQRDDLNVGDAALIIADLEALNNAGGGGGAVASVTGDIVDNTDPANPVINIVLSQTVAEAQIADGTYVPGSHITITDPQSGDCTCSATFLVKADGYISSTGWGTFLNAAMSAAVPVKIEYILAIDKIISVYAYETDVLVTSWYNVTGITSWPFDSTTIKVGKAIDPLIVNVDVTAIMTWFNFKGFNTITIDAGATFSGDAGIEATVTLNDTALWIGPLGDNAGLTMSGTQSLTWCELGNNKNADFSGLDNTAYTAVGKVYIGNISTFEINSTDSAAVNPDVTNIIDMATFPWAGILIVEDGTNELTDFTAFPTDHRVKLIINLGGGTQKINWGNNGGSGAHLLANINLTGLGQTTLANTGDFAVFQANFDSTYINAVELFQTT